MSSSEGTKVTKDPQALSNPKNENPGVVTSDSVAGESVKEGGSFAANADARGPMDQPSRSTNTNTTDTSGATQLDPAPDAEARQASAEWSENSQMNAAEGLGQDAGKGPTYSGAAQGGGVSDSTNSATHPAGFAANDNLQPRGKNITEGGFDGNEPNASFTTDIGGKDDPGRAALGGMQQGNVPSAGGAGPREGEVTNDGQYDVLKDASA
ncbi:hypothetical protein LTR37_002391 [Vermiconidia calcicola]|uniref:Uncharacterized protein n=1 Tax=Vermiconidia calcicola TaxID=1690605 RepID=A0ACC3NUC5_9PEZI|nr:hypothetical protein LTR37_002391 [Vermiconidia calcicola]